MRWSCTDRVRVVQGHFLARGKQNRVEGMHSHGWEGAAWRVGRSHDHAVFLDPIPHLWAAPIRHLDLSLLNSRCRFEKSPSPAGLTREQGEILPWLPSELRLPPNLC